MTTREEVDAFKTEQGVASTPVTFIEGNLYATSEALEQYLASAPAE